MDTALMKVIVSASAEEETRVSQGAGRPCYVFNRLDPAGVVFRATGKGDGMTPFNVMVAWEDLDYFAGGPEQMVRHVLAKLRRGFLQANGIEAREEEARQC